MLQYKRTSCTFYIEMFHALAYRCVSCNNINTNVIHIFSYRCVSCTLILVSFVKFHASVLQILLYQRVSCLFVWVSYWHGSCTFIRLFFVYFLTGILSYRYFSCAVTSFSGFLSTYIDVANMYFHISLRVSCIFLLE